MPNCFALRACVLFAGVLVSVASAQAATIVTADLQDKTSNSQLHDMAIKLDRESAPAGEVTFNVTNVSKALLHEMIIVRTDLVEPALPYIQSQSRADEKQLNSMGEVAHLAAGKKGSITLNLTPGSYLLICNQPDHLHKGMWHKFTVTP